MILDGYNSEYCFLIVKTTDSYMRNEYDRTN